MNLRRSMYPQFMVFLLIPAARGQEGVRDLTGSAAKNKFLTSNHLDRWVFAGEKGEAIIAHVVSENFDPILELARTGTTEKKSGVGPRIEV